MRDFIDHDESMHLVPNSSRHEDSTFLDKFRAHLPNPPPPLPSPLIGFTEEWPSMVYSVIVEMKSNKNGN